MTVPSSLAEATFDWTGIETNFACGFQARQAADISVLYTPQAGAPYFLAFGANFGVVINPSTQMVTVTRVSFPTTPGTITVYRNSVFLQDVDFVDGEATAAETFETLFDDAVRRDQELKRDASLALALAKGAVAANAPRGEWSSATAYAVGDWVTRNGSSYRALVDNINIDPASSTATWFLIAAKGEQGTQGPQGAQGIQGIQGIQGVPGQPGSVFTTAAGGAVRVANAAALPAFTATATVMTASANGAFPAQDGVTLSVGDRFFHWDHTGNNGSNPAYGIYTLTTAGNAGAPWTATRAIDADTAGELGLVSAFVREGTVNAGRTLAVTNSPGAITLATTPIVVTIVGGNASISAEAAARISGDATNATAISTLSAALRQDAPDVSNFDKLIVDSAGNFAGGFHRNLGPVGSRSNLAVSPRVYAGAGNLTWAIDSNVLIFIPVTGQSLAAGQNNDAGAVAGQTAPTTQTATAVDPGFALMFSPGLYPFGRDVSNGFVDMFEQAFNPGGEPSKQTICGSFAASLNSRLLAALGARPRLAMAVAARGGQPYRTLKRGGSIGVYAELLRLVLAARDHAHANGWRLIVPAIINLHGQSEGAEQTTRAQYMRYQDQLLADFTEDVQSINPQPIDPWLFNFQIEPTATTAGVWPDIAQAQLDLHRQRDRIRCVGPIYSYAHETNAVGGLHLWAIGYHKLGETIADIVLGELFGLPNGGPLHVERFVWNTNTQLDLFFNMPVSLDVSGTIITTTGLGNQGLEFVDASGATPAISSVTAPGGGAPNVIRITLASAPTGRHQRVFVGCRRGAANVGGPVSGPRTTIRSTASFANSTSDSAALYHWACHQVIEV